MAESKSSTHHDDETYHSHAGRYVAAGIALFVLSAATYSFHFAPVGATTALVIAMLIAFTKAMIVVLFFMHLWDHPGANRLVLGVTILLLGFGMLMVFADSVTRFLPSEPHF